MADKWVYLKDRDVRHLLEKISNNSLCNCVNLRYIKEIWCTDRTGLAARRGCSLCVKIKALRK